MKKFLKGLTFFAYIAIVIWNFIKIDSHSHSVSDTLINFVPEAVLLTVAFVLLIIIINDIDLIMEKNHR